MTIMTYRKKAFLLGALLATFSGSWILPAAAQAPATIPVAAPATTVPSDANSRAHTDWFKECQDRVAATQGKPVDIVFIGDSITQNWTAMPTGGWGEVGGTVWPQWYGARHALDFGVGADKTQDVLWRLDTMDVKSFRPKVAVVLVGTNNTNDTPADIAAGVGAVVRKTQQTFPGVKVILMSILPNRRANARMIAANTLIKPLADERSVFYFDLASLMTPVGDNWKGIGADHLHLTPEGYQLWASAMEPLLDRLLATPAAAAPGAPLPDGPPADSPAPVSPPLTVPPAGKPVSRPGPFLLGADISWVPEEEAAGATYYDNGVKKDIFDILKKYKFNYIRLRIFVDPQAPGGYAAHRPEAFCDLAHTEAMAKRVKAAGMGFLLDFHYSDTWASPGKQFKPLAWQNLSFADLTATVHTYTRTVVQALKDQGTPPDMVAVGNEITDGMLFPDGRASNFDQFATLVRAGIAGVHDVDPKIKIMLHHHLGRSDLVVRAWVDNLLARGVKFDVLGLSCYAQAHDGDWKTTFDDVSARYPDKLIVAAEYTGHKRLLNDLVYDTPNKRGLGTFIWEPIQYREAIFDKNGVNAGGGAAPVPERPGFPSALPATPAPSAAPATATVTPPATRPFRGPRNGGRYDTNDFIKLYPQMSADYGNK